MSPGDAVDTRPAVHPSDGVARVNCAVRQNSPRLSCDHVMTGRSKAALGKGLARGRGLGRLSLRLSVICQSVITRARQMLECLYWQTGFSQRKAGGREGELEHSSSSSLIAVSQRAPSKLLHPSDRHFSICLKEDVKPENELFLASPSRRKLG